MKIIEIEQKFKLTYKNYISVLWNSYRRKNKIKVILRNTTLEPMIVSWAFAAGYPYLTHNEYISNVRLEGNDIRFTYKGKDINFIDGEFGDIGGVFGLEEYSFLEIEHEIVVDIGANIGDSPIYFALNNAKKVITLEPYPYSYNIASKNIMLNNLGDNITLLNAGYGGDGSVRINPDFKNLIDSDLKSFNEGVDIRTFSLKTLLNDYHIDKAVLKMDCEGCEYNLLKEDNNTLKKFKRIQIEYHNGYEKLKEKLEDAGFTVTYSESRKLLGYIYAR